MRGRHSSHQYRLRAKEMPETGRKENPIDPRFVSSPPEFLCHYGPVGQSRGCFQLEEPHRQQAEPMGFNKEVREEAKELSLHLTH